MNVAALVLAIFSTILSASVAIVGALINRSTQAMAENLRSDHAQLLLRYQRDLQREDEAEATLARYREPLVSAAFDLQHRLGNIVDAGFLVYLRDGSERDADARDSTLFRVAQYFGWTEILRRDIEFLQFRKDEETRAVWEALTHVSRAFASDGYKERAAFMLWVEEQRGIGERMIVSDGGRPGCMGYASFVDQREKNFTRWFPRFESDLRNRILVEKSERLPEVQSLLIKLVKLLDPKELRYSHKEMDRLLSTR